MILWKGVSGYARLPMWLRSGDTIARPIAVGSGSFRLTFSGINYASSWVPFYNGSSTYLLRIAGTPNITVTLPIDGCSVAYTIPGVTATIDRPAPNPDVVHTQCVASLGASGCSLVANISFADASGYEVRVFSGAIANQFHDDVVIPNSYLTAYYINNERCGYGGTCTVRFIP